MNPSAIMQTLVNTLALGAAARQQAAHPSVVRAYQRLTDHLRKNYPEIDLSRVEAQPTSQRGQDYLIEDLRNAHVEEDTSLLPLAAALSEAVASHQPQAAQVVAVDLQAIKAKLARFRNLDSSVVGLRASDSEFDEMEVDTVNAGGKGSAVECSLHRIADRRRR